MSWALGIDLGTTYSTAAVVASGRLEMVGLGAHSSAIPSAVFQGDDVTVVGEAAIVQGDVRPARLAVEFKRQFGESLPILVGDRFITADELQGILGVWVFRRACEREGSTPSEVVFTFPAFWGAFRRDSFLSLTRDVVKDTAPVSVVTEPEAAAAYYASRERVPVDAVVGVYDFGGGTFDASVLRRTEDGFQVLGRPAGDDHLGGIDLDTVLLRHVVQQAGVNEDELDSTDVQRIRQVMTLRRNVTLAKELLSEQPTTDIGVAVNGTMTSIRLSRRELETLAEPIITRTLDVFEEALAFASVTPNELHSILLVGGASRMPRVAEAAGERWSIPIALDSHPKFAVSLGAAVWTLARESNEIVRVASLPPNPTAPPPAEDVGMPAYSAGPTPGATRRLRWVGAAIGAAVVALIVLFAVAFRSSGSGHSTTTPTQPTTSAATTAAPTTVPPSTVALTTVPPPPLTTTPPSLVGLTADSPKITLQPGQSQTVTISGTMSNGQSADLSSLPAAVWKSDNSAVVKVSDGTVTAVAPGSATVTATVGNSSVPIRVDVAPPATTVKSTANTTRTRPPPGGGGTGGGGTGGGGTGGGGTGGGGTGGSVYVPPP